MKRNRRPCLLWKLFKIYLCFNVNIIQPNRPNLSIYFQIFGQSATSIATTISTAWWLFSWHNMILEILVIKYKLLRVLLIIQRRKLKRNAKELPINGIKIIILIGCLKIFCYEMNKRNQYVSSPFKFRKNNTSLCYKRKLIHRESYLKN